MEATARADYAPEGTDSRPSLVATVKRTFTAIVTDEAAPQVVPATLKRLAREAPGIQCHIEQISMTSRSR